MAAMDRWKAGQENGQAAKGRAGVGQSQGARDLAAASWLGARKHVGKERADGVAQHVDLVERDVEVLPEHLALPIGDADDAVPQLTHFGSLSDFIAG